MNKVRTISSGMKLSSGLSKKPSFEKSIRVSLLIVSLLAASGVVVAQRSTEINMPEMVVEVNRPERPVDNHHGGGGDGRPASSTPSTQAPRTPASSGPSAPSAPVNPYVNYARALDNFRQVLDVWMRAYKANMELRAEQASVNSLYTSDSAVDVIARAEAAKRVDMATVLLKEVEGLRNKTYSTLKQEFLKVMDEYSRSESRQVGSETGREVWYAPTP
jgi:hypothetical protein